MRLMVRCFVLWIAAGIASPAVVFASDVGMVAPFVSTYCPTGWIELHGGSPRASASSFPELYALLHKTSTWGSGTQGGIAFEGLPALAGSFVRAWSGVAQSTDSGRAFGTAQVDGFQGHKHDGGFYSPVHTSYYNEYWRYGSTGRSASIITPNVGWIRVTQYTNWTGETETSTFGNVRNYFETRPINIALLYCVKAVDNSGGSSVIPSTFTLVDVSTTAIAQLNPGIWGYFTAGDVSFWFGVLVAIIVIVGFKAGGLR